MTYLELVNKVLVKLRLDQVSSINDGYSRLIGSLVNETKREVEDAWNWGCLRTSITVNTEKGIFSYQLDGAGSRSRLLYDSIRRPSAWNITSGTRLMGPMPGPYMTEKLALHPASGAPIYFDFNGTVLGDPLVNIWPIPDKSYQLQFDLVTPQEDLRALSDTLRVPYWPVILGAYAKAVSERGEDGGVTYTEAEAQYMQALSDAIQIDAGHFDSDLISEVV